ncbi:MAG TPA: methyltransferase domain-containing protein [Vicinamibacterales bacterium]|nr:methyltransferase domain-containing protein [Vicinamibacterales bacterium]
MPRYRYLLGDSRREFARLRHQADIWDPTAHALFDRLKVTRGWRVLEIGPGQGSLHMHLRRRVRRPVDAVEPSGVFADSLRRRSQRDGFGAGTLWECNLVDAPLPRNTYDLIFARWVFLFLPNPAAHLKKLITALKPGGRLAIQDYSRWTLRMAPEPPEWENFLKADGAFFQSQGGDVNIGARLPQLYADAGLDVVDITPTIKFGRPGNAEWKWLTTYFLGVLPRYAAFRPFTPKQADSLRRHWLACATRRTSLLISPTVLDVVGRKPSA